MWGGRIPVVSPYPRIMNTATDYVITIDVGEQIIQSAIIMYVHTAGLNCLQLIIVINVML